MFKNFRIWITLFMFLGLASGFVFAQSRVTGIIQGKITEEEGGALPGVSVTVSSPSLMGTRSMVTDSDGRYRVPALPTGSYTVDVTLQGFVPVKKTNIEVHAGVTATVDFVLEPAKIEEEITVTGQAPIIDVTDSSLSKTFITKDVLEKLPTARDPYELLNLAPGVAYEPSWWGVPGMSAYGGGVYTGNSYQIDGVEIMDAYFGGGTYTMRIDYNVIEESQIIALGAPAEYGNFTGAIVNLITKSGGNTLSGDAQLFVRGKTWQDDNIDKTDPKWSLIPESPLNNLFQASTHLGGPIFKDKLWFFLGYEYYKSTTEMESLDKSSPMTWPKYFAKLSFQPTDKDRLTGFFEYHNRTTRRGVLSPTWEDVANFDYIHNVWIGSLSFLHTFSLSTILELKFAGHYKTEDVLPSSGDTSRSGHIDLITGEVTRNGWAEVHWPESRFTGSAALSHNVSNFLGGSHDFKFGAKAERSWIGNSGQSNGGVVYYDLNHEPYQATNFTWRMGGVIWRYSFYAQDDWKIGESLVINPGLRFNIYRGSIPDLQDKLVYTPTALEPRIGFVWDIFKTHKTVLKAHYGRYYEGTKCYYIARLTPKPDQTWYSVGPDWSSLTPLYTVSGASLYSMDPETKAPSMDQVVAGVEQVIGKDFSASVSLIYKKWRNFIESVNTTALFEPISITDPETGQIYTVYNQLNPGQDHYYITNPKKGKNIGAAYPDIVGVTPWRSYKGIQFTINKRFSNNWQFYASYVYSREEGTYSNFHTEHQSFEMAGSSIYWDPTNQINLKGRSVISPPHVLKIQGTYIFPLDISLSASYSYTSGRTWTRNLLVTSVNQSSPYLMTEPMGSRRLPAASNLDLRVEKLVRYKNFRLSLMLDIFNVFNQGRETILRDVVGPLFGMALGVNAPRAYRAGVRVWF